MGDGGTWVLGDVFKFLAPAMPVLTKYEAVNADEPKTPPRRGPVTTGSRSEKKNVSHRIEPLGLGYADEEGDADWEQQRGGRGIRTPDHLRLGEDGRCDTPTEDSVRHRALFFSIFGVRFRCSVPKFVSSSLCLIFSPFLS